MNLYRVEFVKSAQKEFNKLQAAVKKKVTEALFFLSQNPFSEILKIKKLRGADHLYRLRIGDCRVVYEVRQHLLIVVVIKIGHRKDIYRFL